MTGLLRLQEMYQRIPPGRGGTSILIEIVRRIDTVDEATDFLRSLEANDRFASLHFLLVSLNGYSRITLE